MSSVSLEQQRRMCDEAMALVNAGVALQSKGDHLGAERNLTQAVDLMETALELDYPSTEEQDAAVRLNKKMWRYVKMIKSQREKQATSGGGASSRQGQGSSTRSLAQRSNIIEMDAPAETYRPVLHLMMNSTSYGDVFRHLKCTFGFQDANVLNQKEHLLLLLTNERLQMDNPTTYNNRKMKKKKNQPPPNNGDPQYELNMTIQAVGRFHPRLFSNYSKWCKYVGQKPKYSKDQMCDIVLFFLIWGEAGNLRQCPELLCFLFHKMAPMMIASTGQEQPSGHYLDRVIRPMYDEIHKDNNKKTLKGARAPHAQVRNYDDFNEFFWRRKCLKFDIYTIGSKAFTGKVRKSFKEKRSWGTALWSFCRVFFFTCALFMATLGFAINMSLVCPDTPIMYGPDLTVRRRRLS